MARSLAVKAQQMPAPRTGREERQSGAKLGIARGRARKSLAL